MEVRLAKRCFQKVFLFLIGTVHNPPHLYEKLVTGLSI